MAVRRLLATLLFLPVLVSCSDDDPDSSGSGDPTTSIHPTPTEPPPPEEPALAGERSKAGAEAFVEYWVETLNYAAATGDTSDLKRIGTQTCQSCSRIAGVIDKVYTEGGHIEGDGWEPKKISGPGNVDGESTNVRAVLNLNPQVIRHGDGSSPDRNPGLDDALATFELVWTSHGWRLREMFQDFA